MKNRSFVKNLGVAILAFITLAAGYWLSGNKREESSREDLRVSMNQSGEAAATANIARDGNVAIREEFDAAVEANTSDALDLFIRRHFDHPLAEKARKILQAIQTSNK